MAHEIDFISLERDLFILEHLAFGSAPLLIGKGVERFKATDARNNLVSAGVDPFFDDFDWTDYGNRLLGIVSTHLLACSVGSRIAWDTIRTKFPDCDLVDHDTEACTGIQLGSLIGDTIQLTLRETWNKTLHATNISLVWVHREGADPNGPLDLWKGEILLRGNKSKRPWELRLDLVAWVSAMQHFLGSVSEDDRVQWPNWFD